MKTSHLNLRNVIAGCKILSLSNDFFNSLHSFLLVAVVRSTCISPSDSYDRIYLTWHHLALGVAASTVASYSEVTRLGSGDEML
jgi:hypothetical protein